MARFYDIAVAALTLRAPRKWVDNLLSRHRIDGVEHGRQGSTRRLSTAAIVRVEIVRILTSELDVPTPRAVELAHRITAGGATRVSLGEGAASLAVDIQRIERLVADRIADAVESAPRAPRGRPPGTRRRT